MKILILGAGKIGTAIAYLLSAVSDYEVTLADRTLSTQATVPGSRSVNLDITEQTAVETFLQINSFDAVVSCLPYFLNLTVAQLAQQYGMHYFDLTEDVTTTNKIAQLAAAVPHAFVSQCGLAPGYINIIAHHLMQEFDDLESIKLRVGALPIYTSNALHYALTWSIDGLINEYGNYCEAIIDGKLTSLPALSDLETIELDGIIYEAFNTSGGVGTLCQTYAHKVKHLEYKTLRYPGHCEKMRFLMHDLKLNRDRNTLKMLLERAIPTTTQDVVLIYVAVSGYKNRIYSESSYFKKIYPVTINDYTFTAIQIATASSLCSVLDLVLAAPASQYGGFIRQEQFSYNQFIANRFGKYYG